MIKSNKNKKKKGFTLVEIIAVIAIIGILAAVLVPSVMGYIREAKKTAVIDQARKVVTAWESVKIKTNKTGDPADTYKLADLQAASGNLIEVTKLDKINGSDSSTEATVLDCIHIIDSEKYSFTVNDAGKLNAKPQAIAATP